jgi:hypothetical protein
MNFMQAIMQAFSNPCVQLVIINTSVYSVPMMYACIHTNSLKPFFFTIVPFLLWNNIELLECADLDFIKK